MYVYIYTVHLRTYSGKDELLCVCSLQLVTKSAEPKARGVRGGLGRVKGTQQSPWGNPGKLAD